MSDHDDVAAEAADPTTEQARLMELAYEHPETRPLVAKNPNTYPDLLAWLANLAEPDVDEALAERGYAPETDSRDTDAADGEETDAANAAPSEASAGQSETLDAWHHDAPLPLPDPPEESWATETQLAPPRTEASAGPAFPAGMVPPAPSWQPPAGAAAPKRSRGTLLAVLGGVIAGLIVVAVLLVAFVPEVRFWESDGPETHAEENAPAPADQGAGGADTSPQQSAATECTTPVSADLTGATMDNGALVIDLALHSQCDQGQLLDSPALTVTIMQNGAPTGTTTVDLSNNPVAVGGPAGSAASLRVAFPAGATSATAADISAGDGAAEVTYQPNASARPMSDGQPSVSATGTSKELTDAEAKVFLKSRSALDSVWVGANLVGQWVPQLSSKKVGLKADGITYNNVAIWKNYVDLMSKYPNARLLWSGDWDNYTRKDFWVVIDGEGFGTGAAANSWCDGQGIGASDCFATQVRTSGGKDGATQYR